MVRVGRIEGVDVARALAGLIMIQGHAYDGWVEAGARGSVAYGVTRLLGTFPLPSFLVLAGASIALRVDAGARRGESAAALKRQIAWRGMQVVGYGYLVSIAFALMDGHRGLGTLLRADVLHVIGLSIVAVALVGIAAGKGKATPDPRRLALVAGLVGVVVLAVSPWVNAWTAATAAGPARYLVALFGDVPGVTLMPLFPLLTWVCLGVVAGHVLVTVRQRTRDVSPGGAPTWFFLATAGVGATGAVLGSFGTDWMVAALDGELSRAHPAVWLNAIDLAGRALVVLAAGGLLASRLPAWSRPPLLRLGRGSLVAYVFHIPFCYGALGVFWRGKLSMAEATLWVLALMAASTLAVFARDRLRTVSWPGRQVRA